jgi:hypothetical protein
VKIAGLFGNETGQISSSLDGLKVKRIALRTCTMIQTSMICKFELTQIRHKDVACLFFSFFLYSAICDIQALQPDRSTTAYPQAERSNDRPVK